MSLLLLMEEESLPTYRIMDQQQPLSYSLSASASSPPSSENESNPSDAVIFFGLSLALGIACRHLLRGTRVPYTVALLILGIALGSLGSSSNFTLLLLLLLLSSSSLLNHLWIWLINFYVCGLWLLITIEERTTATTYQVCFDKH